MEKVIVNGANGKMGRLLCEELSKEYEIIKVDISNKNNKCIKLSEIGEKGRVLVDFSHKNALEEVVCYCVTYKTPLIIGTTGYSEKDLELIDSASRVIPVMMCKNFAEGVNILTPIFEQISQNDFDTINIIETHHKEKADYPSGTAKLFADAICKKSKYICSISDYNSSHVQKDHINLHSIRSGTVFGEHSVIFAKGDETITITHNANSRDPFVKGVEKAVKFMITKKIPGLYGYEDIKNKETEK